MPTLWLRTPLTILALIGTIIFLMVVVSNRNKPTGGDRAETRPGSSSGDRRRQRAVSRRLNLLPYGTMPPEPQVLAQVRLGKWARQTVDSQGRKVGSCQENQHQEIELADLTEIERRGLFQVAHPPSFDLVRPAAFVLGIIPGINRVRH